MIYGHFAYRLFLLLHLLSVVVGFGPWVLNGFFPNRALKAGDAEGRAINGVNFEVSRFSQFGMYGVLVFGFAALGAAQKHTIEASDAWVAIGLVCWVLAVGALHGLVLPAQRKLAAGDGDRAALTQRQSLGAAAINVLLVIAVIVMIWEPGGPRLI